MKKSENIRLLEILREELIVQVSTGSEKQQHLNRLEKRNGRKNFIEKLQLGDVYCRSTSAKPADKQSPQQTTSQVHQTGIKAEEKLELTYLNIFLKIELNLNLRIRSRYVSA